MSKWRKTNRAKRVDSSCKNHGRCPVCRDNRTRQGRVARLAAEDQLKNYEEEKNAER